MFWKIFDSSGEKHENPDELETIRTKIKRNSPSRKVENIRRSIAGGAYCRGKELYHRRKTQHCG